MKFLLLFPKTLKRKTFNSETINDVQALSFQCPHSDINLGDEIIKPTQVHRAVQMLLPTHQYTVDYCLAKLCMVFRTTTRISAFDNFAYILVAKTKTLRRQIDINMKMTAQSSLTGLNFSVFHR